MTEPSHDPIAEPIDWAVAEQVAERLLRSAAVFDRDTLKRLDDDFLAATAHGEALVEEVTGLHSTAGPARAIVTDRSGWVRANVGSFRRLLAPLSKRMNEHQEKRPPGPAGRMVAGAEVGVVLSWMSKRVLGQYDLLPYDAASGGDALYYVGPNVVTIERRHGFPPNEFRLWIALHELTHRAQFTGVPWMRDYFFSLVERAIDIATPDASEFASALLSRLMEEIRERRNPLAQGGVVAMFASKDQLDVLREAQAFMSLLEGHGNYVMSRAGASEITGAKRFARVLADRRNSATGFAKLIQQALGLEAKLRQYAEGEEFVEAIVRSGGDELLARVWQGPEMLPSLDEIRTPRYWIDRVGGAAASIA